MKNESSNSNRNSFRKYFQCPGCGSILIKNQVFLQEAIKGAVILGSRTCTACTDCKTRLDNVDIYSGKYDFYCDDCIIDTMRLDPVNEVIYDIVKKTWTYMNKIIHGPASKIIIPDEFAVGENMKELSEDNKPLQTVRFLYEEKTSRGTYEVYEANDAESAKKFLHLKKVETDYHYILVETPEGAWGLDKLGLYLEHLLPFQLNIDSVDCEGSANVLLDSAGFQSAAIGSNESFVSPVECGRCKNQWEDAIRYQNVTAVKCPKCKSVNKINTKGFHIFFNPLHEYKLFELFLDGLTEEGRAKAIETMSSTRLLHELLAIYPDESSFENSMSLTQSLPYHFHPICMRFEKGGIIYIRCHFESDSEYYRIFQSFEKGSKQIFTVPDEMEVAFNGIRE